MESIWLVPPFAQKVGNFRQKFKELSLSVNVVILLMFTTKVQPIKGLHSTFKQSPGVHRLYAMHASAGREEEQRG